MKKALMILCMALLGGAAMYAQQIAVVSPEGNTNVYQTLDEAINSASNGSVIYLPGGGFSIKDETKITKRLTLIGLTHKANADNADGNTRIGGNLNFDNGSDGSAVMGVYLTGDVNVGVGTDSVTNLTVKYCNVNSLQIKKSNCSGTIVNQCYLRNASSCNNANIVITNSIFHSITYMTGGTICHNVITSHSYRFGYNGTSCYCAFLDVYNASIMDNILLDPGTGNGYNIHQGSDCQIYNNMLTREWGENCIVVSSMEDVFVDSSHGISTASNFQLAGDDGKNAASDGTDVGIYGGPNGDANFSEDAFPPIPRIISKKIDEQTDGSGKLTMKISVKAY